MNTYTESDGALTRNKHTRPCVGYYHPIAGAWEVYTDSVLCHLSCLGALVSYFVRRTAHAHMSSSALVGHLRTCRPTHAMGDDDAEPACKRRRRDADALATELLDAGRQLSDADVLAVLSRWSFRPNKNRQNVLPEGADFVYSDTLGLTRDRKGTVAVDAYTRQLPNVFRFLGKWIKQRRPVELAHDFPFTSISLNYNYAARLHRDG